MFVGEYGALRRPVAIKLLHRHLIGKPMADRMLGEARTLRDQLAKTVEAAGAAA